MPNITFVDENDTVTGHGSKTEALSRGLVHRIVRVYITNANGDILIQKRSATVDAPNLWDQSAAGHVDEGEEYDEAAIRELREEVGIAGVSLRKLVKYYSEETDNGVLRKRFNTLYATRYDGKVKMDGDEVAAIKWIKPDDLARWMQDSPDDFTQGFRESYSQYLKAT